MPRPLARAMLTILPLLTGCATGRHAEKPVLTAHAVTQIATRCGAVRGRFRPSRTTLPSADFTLRADDQGDAQSSPTVRCLGTALDAYRHDYFGFAPETKTTPSS